MTFTVTSSLGGKAVCSAKIFLWNEDDKVVISDVDGTITK
jgi:phosphatidate phosphatase LPIN